MPRVRARPDDGWRLAAELTSSRRSSSSSPTRSRPCRRAAPRSPRAPPLVQRGLRRAAHRASRCRATPVTPLLFDDLNPALAAVVAGDATPDEAIAGVRARLAPAGDVAVKRAARCAGACCSCSRSRRSCRPSSSACSRSRARATTSSDEVERGALAHIRALGAALDGTLQDARRTVELAAATWADAPGDARATQLLAAPAAPRRADRRSRCRSSIPTARSSRRSGAGRASTSARTASAATSATRRSSTAGPVVHLVVQARGRTGELMGVFVASLDLGFVRDVIAAARLGPGARVIVVDGAGVPVATSDPRARPAGRRSPAAIRPSIARSRRRSRARCRERLGQRVSQPVELPVAARRALGDPPRAARGRRLRARAPHDARHDRRSARVALALALALGAFFATRLTRPLAALARAPTRSPPAHAPPTRPPIRGPGEIGVLAQRGRRDGAAGSPSAPSSQRRSRAAIGSRRSA